MLFRSIAVGLLDRIDLGFPLFPDPVWRVLELATGYPALVALRNQAFSVQTVELLGHLVPANVLLTLDDSRHCPGVCPGAVSFSKAR